MKYQKHEEYISIPVPEEVVLYEMKMLEKNNIQGLLTAREGTEDGKTYMHYHTAGYQCLCDIYEKEKLDSQMVQTVIYQLISTIQNMQRYLLDYHHLNLYPDYIFLPLSEDRIFFCYQPWDERPFYEQIRELAHWILDHMDYKERDGVVFAYQLQHFCDDTEVTIDLLEQFMTLKDRFVMDDDDPLELGGEGVESEQQGAADDEMAEAVPLKNGERKKGKEKIISFLKKMFFRVHQDDDAEWLPYEEDSYEDEDFYDETEADFEENDNVKMVEEKL